MRVKDPFRKLTDEATYAAAHRITMRTEAAAYVRWVIAEHLADLVANDDLELPFTQGYRMGLRVAFVAAGGDVDGSEEAWAQVENRG